MAKYTIQQFETALFAQGAQIEDIKTPNRFVREASGFMNGKRMIWNSNGECFQNRVAKPEFNLVFKSEMKPIKFLPEISTLVETGEIMLFFDKSGKGMREINDDPNAWNLDMNTTNVLQRVATEQDPAKVAIMQPPYKVGEIYPWHPGDMEIKIINSQLIRLDNITEEDAQRTGLAKTKLGYKHYCPETMFPPSVLKKQEEGFPYMKDARGSLFTLWVKKYGVLEIPLNPWIWRYEFKFCIAKDTQDDNA